MKNNTNIEIYSYLNIVNRRLGKLYKMTGFSCLPPNFVVNEEKFKELLFLKQLQNTNIIPPFIFNDKKNIKKYFKNSLKNCKKILKNNSLIKKYSNSFEEKLLIYFSQRIELTDMILKDFKSHDFDETSAYQEIYNLNPILGEIFKELFEENFSIQSLPANLEEEYEVSYLEKISLLEKKSTKKQKEKDEINNITTNKEIIKNAKKHEKNIENNKKTRKKAEIKEIKHENKKTLTTIKDKEK